MFEPSITRTLALLATTLLLPACSSLSSVHPIGEIVTADLSPEFDGAWQFNDTIVAVRAVGEGKLRVAALQWDNGRFKVDAGDVLVTEHHGVRLLHAIDKRDDAQDARYQPLRVSMTEKGEMVGFAPKYAAFATAVEAGELTGTAKRRKKTVTVRLTATKKELDSFLTKARLDSLFEMSKPVVMTRVAKKE